MSRFLPTLLSRFQTSRRKRAPKPRRPKHPVLRLERLEDRITPTVLFTPQFGAETTTGGSRVLNDNPGTNIYMIYRGSYWATSAGQTMATNIQNSVDNLLYFSPYLDGLHQYGVPYRAYAPAISNNHVFNYTDMPNGFSTTDIANTVQDAIYNKGLPEADTYSNRAIYFVVTAPGVVSNISGAGAYHTAFTDNHNANDPDTVFDGWIGGPSLDSLDTRTYYLSHETAEAMTDPYVDSTGIMTHGGLTGGGVNEICDAEAQNYTYRLNSYLVNSYWSTANNAYMVSDGNTQTVTVNNRNLIVNGNQLANHNDTITLDVSGGGVRVTENGEVFQFDPGAISSITVNTGDGTDTVNVLRTVTPVNINYGGGGGADVANLGTGGSVSGIQGAVNISNGPSYTHVNIDDSADPFSRNVSIGSGGVSGLGSAAINFGNVSLNTLSVNGGTGNNTYTVTGSQAYQGTTLNTGNGVDTVNVLATPYALTLNYQGGGSSDVANLGSGGSMQSITGAVTIVNGPSYTHVNLNDSADSASRNVTIGSGGVTGLAPAAINFNSGSANTLTVNGGTGNNTYTVTGSPAYQGTTLNTGPGTDTVNVLATTAPLNVNGGGGQDVVNVGSATGSGGSLANILGAINVTNAAGQTRLFVYDDGDTTARTGTLDNGSLRWINYAAPITWTPITSSTGGVKRASIFGGRGGNTFTVNNTSISDAFDGTDLNTGAGNNTVYVLGTTSDLFINDGGAHDTVRVGSTTGSGGSLANINGYLSVGGGATSLTIDDSGDATGQTATLNNNPFGQLLWNSYAAEIDWSDQGVSSVTINGGSGGNTFSVDNESTLAPTTLNAGAGSDTVKMQGLASPLTVHDQGSNNTLDYSGYTGDVTVDIPLGTASLISGGISGIQNVIGSNGNDILVGNGSGNVLTGGTGRNLLIAGSAAGTLQGNAADNIFIGGFTQYDSDLTSLALLMAEWTRTDLGYADRVNDIMNGGGLNGSAVLNASTVTGNGGGNTLMGAAGALNLYFGNLSNDQTDYDPTSGEVFVSV